jgi:hypothetical protein
MAMNQGLTLGFHATETPGFGLTTSLLADAAPVGDNAADCEADKGLS